MEELTRKKHFSKLNFFELVDLCGNFFVCLAHEQILTLC